jgi:hypothetical protein
VLEMIKDRPTLLYCDMEVRNILLQLEIAFIDMNVDQPVDYKRLRTLNNGTSKNG